MTMHSSGTWIDICDVADIPVRGSRIVKAPSGCIAVFRTVDGEVFALDDQCPHKQGPISQGIVHGRSVTCPLHNWVISLESGEAEGLDEGSTPVHQLRVVEDRVHLFISVNGADASSDSGSAR